MRRISNRRSHPVASPIISPRGIIFDPSKDVSKNNASYEKCSCDDNPEERLAAESNQGQRSESEVGEHYARCWHSPRLLQEKKEVQDGGAQVYKSPGSVFVFVSQRLEGLYYIIYFTAVCTIHALNRGRGGLGCATTWSCLSAAGSRKGSPGFESRFEPLQGF
jgi:hypothetical protein